MGISDKIQHENLEYICLEDFLYVLDYSLSGSGDNAFNVLFKFLDKGLPLRFTESGYVFDEQLAFKGDIKCALIRSDKLFDTIEPASKFYKDQIVTTQDGIDVSIGKLLVKRSDLEKVYLEYGEAQYPWPLILKPQSINDWGWVPVDAKLECNTPNEVRLTAPLDKPDKEMQEMRIVADGAPTLSLRNFIEHLLVEATGTRSPLSAFYSLVEEYGLVVYDKVIEGQTVSPSELLVSFRQREQQADKSFDEDGFQFWETLTKESKYSILRDDLEKAYKQAGKSQFPWLNIYDTLVWLNVEDQAKVVSVTDDSSRNNNKTPTKTGSKRVTKLNYWLREKWEEWDKPNARDFAAKLKPFAGALGSPVKKYHGWLPKPNTILEWQSGWGSISGSWTLATFSNKVDDFKRDDRKAGEKNSCQ